ncbi:MAG: hypothetical protein IKK20_01625, partial [Clostridia bacterium]|nr:hypothetical protein [Clostridia bacterium]
ASDKARIAPQKLCTPYVNNQYAVSQNQFLFPMAGGTAGTTTLDKLNSEGAKFFGMEDYLTTNNKRISYYIGSSTPTTYFARSGSVTYTNEAYVYLTDGVPYCKVYSYGSNYYVTNAYNMRPAFVLQLYSA